MNIEVISFWYNEAFLAPFFLKHYEPAQRIRIIVDADTDDATRDLLRAAPNVIQEDFKFDAGLNTQVMQDVLNAAYRESGADWVLMVDADEFLVLEDLKYARDPSIDALFAMLYQVYRHESDVDLDAAMPAMWQRRHGDPNITDGINALYQKPIIARTGKGYTWVPGCHAIRPTSHIRFGQHMVRGAHWAMADPCFCIGRRLATKARISEYNKAHGMSWHNWHVTQEGLEAVCAAHLQDPRVL